MNTPKIPTREENPNGLHQRYIVTHASDNPDDPEALYFVLKLNSKDPAHKRACRLAAWEYVDAVRTIAHMPQIPEGACKTATQIQVSRELLQVAKDLESLLIKTQDNRD